MAQQAAVLQGLAGGAYGQSGGRDASALLATPSPEEPSLSEQMNARMMHLASGGGGAKMKLLRRDAPAAASASADTAAAPVEQKTAEQKQREYEERRAAIFGPTATTVVAPSPPQQTQTQPLQRIVKRDSGQRASGSPPPSHSPAFDADSSESQVQATPAALAEVHAQHSKRTQQHQHNASRGKAQSHRIIEDLVGNRVGQTRSNTHSPQSDPDFGRSSRRGQHGRRQHGGAGGQQHQQAFSAYPAASPAYPYGGGGQFAPVGVDAYGRPVAVGIAPGNAQSQQFAQGPQGNGIGFARGQQQSQGGAVAFNPGAQPFYPSSYPYAMQPQQAAPPSAWPAPLSSPAELGPMIRLVAPTAAQPTATPAYAQPNVFMGSGGGGGGVGRGGSGGAEANANRR